MPGPADPFRSWSAFDRDDLRLTWEALLPPEEAEPRFRGESVTRQQAGWVFERWIMEAFRLDGVRGYPRFTNPMTTTGRPREEIDGLLYDGWQGFLVEAKHEADRLGIDPIFRLHLMAEQRPVGTIGLLFSLSGFTEPALEIADRLKPIRVLLFDKDDLAWAIWEDLGLLAMVRRKWRMAVRSGRPNMPMDAYIVPFGDP